MASNKIKGTRSGNQKKRTDKNSVVFVPLNGLSQSAKDRQMNKRSLRRPKNLDLIEPTDPDDNMDQRKTVQIPSVPNEYLLSSTIKEANGMDFSNYASEEYFRNLSDSGSVSPDTSDDYITLSSTTNDSIVHAGESPEDTCSSSISGCTATQNNNTENESQADRAEDTGNSMDSDEIDDVISKCRYSKNAAIIGMLKQKFITLDDLNLEFKIKKNDFENTDNSIDEKNGNNNAESDSGGKSEANTNRFADYPYLVQHPDDPDFFTHPLQAFGRVDDAEINYRLPRLGEKSVTTARKFFLQEGLKDEIFEFKPKTTTGSKPKTNVKIPKIPTVDRSRSSSKQSSYSAEANKSYDSFIGNDENEGFTLNRKEFPTLI